MIRTFYFFHLSLGCKPKNYDAWSTFCHIKRLNINATIYLVILRGVLYFVLYNISFPYNLRAFDVISVVAFFKHNYTQVRLSSERLIRLKPAFIHIRIIRRAKIRLSSTRQFLSWFVYLPKPETDNTNRGLNNSSYPTRTEFNNCFIIYLYIYRT